MESNVVGGRRMSVVGVIILSVLLSNVVGGRRMSVVGVIILSVLLSNVVEGRNTVCCKNFWSRKAMEICTDSHTSWEGCLDSSVCKFVRRGACPSGYPDDGYDGYQPDFYCKFGCNCYSSSSTTHSPGDAEAERCNRACSEFCSKSSSAMEV